MANLYMVATPIGNLEDITLRALRILKEVSVIFCEDTRHTKILLDRYEIGTVVMTLHEHSGVGSYAKVFQLLSGGKDVAYVTDAGTPGISDPGGKLVEYIKEQGLDEIEIVPIPGASALSAALSVAGINLERFDFMGFPPVKNKRVKYFNEVVQKSVPVVFYESTFRLLKSLQQLADCDGNLNVVVFGELTKRFEKIYRGRIVEVVKRLEHEDTRGEYVVICYRSKGSLMPDYEEE